MIVDLVHDTQRAYRQLIHAMANPGTRLQILRDERLLELTADGISSTELLSLVLLDADVRASFTGFESSQVEFISRLTAVRQSACADADFLFFAHKSERLREAPLGTHLDPHFGATAFMFFETFPFSSGTQSYADCSIRMHGPGIPGQKFLTINDDCADALWWLAARNECVAEFPLGIDVVVYSRDGGLLAVPRTTKVSLNTSLPVNSKGDL